MYVTYILFYCCLAPTGPPTLFHVVVLNSTAIEAQWYLPLYGLRNGVIRGYRLFVEDALGADIRQSNITDNTTISYIVGGLQPSTRYSFSVLAYTTGDGPRTFRLTAQTRADGMLECIR